MHTVAKKEHIHIVEVQFKCNQNNASGLLLCRPECASDISIGGILLQLQHSPFLQHQQAEEGGGSHCAVTPLAQLMQAEHSTATTLLILLTTIKGHLCTRDPGGHDWTDLTWI